LLNEKDAAFFLKENSSTDLKNVAEVILLLGNNNLLDSDNLKLIINNPKHVTVLASALILEKEENKGIFSRILKEIYECTDKYLKDPKNAYNIESIALEIKKLEGYMLLKEKGLLNNIDRYMDLTYLKDLQYIPAALIALQENGISDPESIVIII
jgi:hypothetical protein